MIQEYEHSLYGICVEISKDIRISTLYLLNNKSAEKINDPMETKNHILIHLLGALSKSSTNMKKNEFTIKTDTKIIKDLLEELMECLADYRVHSQRSSVIVAMNNKPHIIKSPLTPQKGE